MCLEELVGTHLRKPGVMPLSRVLGVFRDWRGPSKPDCSLMQHVPTLVTFYRIPIYVYLLDDDPFMRQLQAVFAPLLGSRGRP